MSDEIFKRMMKKIGTVPKLRILKDTDKDGFINVLDCAPYNKNKDGLWQNIGEHGVIGGIKQEVADRREMRERATYKIESGEVKEYEDLPKRYTDYDPERRYAVEELRKRKVKAAREKAEIAGAEKQARERVERRYNAPKPYAAFGSYIGYRKRSNKGRDYVMVRKKGEKKAKKVYTDNYGNYSNRKGKRKMPRLEDFKLDLPKLF